MQAAALGAVSASFGAVIARASTAAAIAVGVVALVVLGLLALRQAASQGRLGRWSIPVQLKKTPGPLADSPKTTLVAAKRFRAAAALIALGLALTMTYTLGLRHEDEQDGGHAQAVLLKLLVPEVRKQCSGSEDKPGDALAQLTCRDADAGITTTITRFESPAALKAAMDALKASTAAPPGQCFQQAVAVGRYDLDNAPHAGELLCDKVGASQTIAWTNQALVVLGEATQDGKRSPSLLEWWSDRNALLTSSDLRRPFPDEYERRLLEHIPSSFRKSCRRDNYTHDGSSATVRCSPRSGAEDVWYLRFSDSHALARSVRDGTRGWRNADGTCSRSTRQPAVATYSDGTRVCYNESGASWVEWSDDELLIYAYARRRPPGLFRLFAWWRHAAGPL